MDNKELTAYMSGAVERLVKNALKASVTNPRAGMFFMQSRKTMKKAKERRVQHEEAGLHIPTFLISSITKSCNLFCTGCYARANGSCQEKVDNTLLSTKKWSEIFAEAADAGIVFNLLAGGEPLMRREVIEAAAKHKSMVFPVFTNGTMIDEDYLELFKKNPNLIPVVSLEGEDEATDARRGNGVYAQVVEVLEQLREHKIFYGISLTVSRDNLDAVTGESYIRQLYNYGTKLIFFIEYVPVEKGTEELAFDDNDREVLEERQNILREKFEDMLFLSFPGDEKHMGGCLAAGRGFFHINADGEAEACPFSPYSDRSLKDYSLLEVLDSPLFKRLQEEELVGGEHNGGCALFEKEEKVKELAGISVAE